MTEEPENKAPESEEPTPAKAKSPLMKYLVFGGIGIVAILAVAFGVAFFLGTDKPAVVEAHGGNSPDAVVDTAVYDASQAESHDLADAHGESDPDTAPDMSVITEDLSAIETIMENLAFLEYEPDESEVSETETVHINQDSIDQANWIENEKGRLKQWDSDLQTQRRQLEKLDREVTQKLLTLEQAETSRVNSLAKLYDSMDPRAVAQVMANLDDNTVVAILPRMKTKNASSVLALFPPKRGANLSRKMITIAEN